MTELFSQYTSGIQFTAGAVVGSATGTSGLNPIVDRLNSIAPNGSQISGANVTIFANQIGAGIYQGEGIDISNGSVIACEDSTASNKGVVIISAGGGMDVSYSNGTATITGEDATTSNKGIASFNSTYFTTSAGAVSITESSINPTSLGTNCVALDHGTAATDMIVNVCYGSGTTPPTASTTTEGTLYIQYTA